jgi:hypothetical protein
MLCWQPSLWPYLFGSNGGESEKTGKITDESI